MPQHGDLVHLADEPSWDLYQVLGKLKHPNLVRLRRVRDGCLRVAAKADLRVIVRGYQIKMLLLAKSPRRLEP